uniref:Uncharacterized protein n=1 Tax=Arundo donax TaxID=35708 RepID=A0A0A9H761_ARUDO
MFKKFNHT